MKKLESLTLLHYRRPESCPQPPHGCLHPLVPQGVDRGVQDRNDDSEGDGDSSVRGEGGEGPGVDVDAGHKVEGDHRDMGGAGGDGLPPALPGVRPQHGQDDCVGHKQEDEPQGGDQAAVGNHQELKGTGVSAGEGEDLGGVTVETVHDVGPAEGEGQEEGDLHDGVDKAPRPGGRDQPSALASTHDGHVVQGPGDGHVAVKGHHREGEDVRAPEEVEEKYLHEAAVEGDGLSLRKKVRQDLGGGDGGEADVQDGEAAEQEVHGGVQAGLAAHSDRDEEVAQQSGHVPEA